jgi:hypothetical protein
MERSLLNVRTPQYSFIYTKANQQSRLLVKTGRWAGVVTAFITMSGIKDEIDWEFPGAATTEGQTNYFWQGVVSE